MRRPVPRVAAPPAPRPDRPVPLVGAIEVLVVPLVLGARREIVVRDPRVEIATIEIGRRARR